MFRVARGTGLFMDTSRRGSREVQQDEFCALQMLQGEFGLVVDPRLAQEERAPRKAPVAVALYSSPALLLKGLAEWCVACAACLPAKVFHDGLRGCGVFCLGRVAQLLCPRLQILGSDFELGPLLPDLGLRV